MTSDSVPDPYKSIGDSTAVTSPPFDEDVEQLLAGVSSAPQGEVFKRQEAQPPVGNAARDVAESPPGWGPARSSEDSDGAKEALSVVEAMLQKMEQQAALDASAMSDEEGLTPEKSLGKLLTKLTRTQIPPFLVGQFLTAYATFLDTVKTVPTDAQLAELSVEIAKTSAEVTQEEARSALVILRDANWLPGVAAEGLNFTPDQLTHLDALRELLGDAKLLEGLAEALRRWTTGKVATAPAVVERNREIALRDATVEQEEREVDVYRREVKARQEKWGIRRSDPQFLLRVGSTAALAWTVGAAWVQSTYPWVNRVPYRQVWEVDPLLAAGYAPIAFAKGAGSFVVNVAVIGTDLAEALGGKLAELTGTPASPDVTQGTTVAVEEFSVGGKRVRMTNLRTVSLGLSSEASAVSSRSSSSVDPASLAGLSPHPEAMSAEVALSPHNI